MLLPLRQYLLSDLRLDPQREGPVAIPAWVMEAELNGGAQDVVLPLDVGSQRYRMLCLHWAAVQAWAICLEFCPAPVTTLLCPVPVLFPYRGSPRLVQDFVPRLSAALKSAPCGLHVMLGRPDAGVGDDECDALLWNKVLWKAN